MDNFFINGVGIKNPSGFKIERYNISTMNRLANADMVGDLVAKKLKFYFTYDVISSKDLDNILELIWESNSLFFTLKYLENGAYKEATVYVGSIPADLHKGDKSNIWVWRNVSFNLIQR